MGLFARAHASTIPTRPKAGLPERLSCLLKPVQFIDEVRVRVEAGDGGAGCVAFRREKYVPRGGPAGGDGGGGGSVIFVGSENSNTLYHLRHRSLLRAERGRNGEGSRRTGRSGEDLEIEVPLGTVVYALDEPDEDEPQDEPRGVRTGDAMVFTIGDEDDASDSSRDGAAGAGDGEADERPAGRLLGEVTAHGERLIVARGGQGGRGNARFATATRQAPRFAQPGEEGEERWLRCELKLLADVGVVGLPNAGKSTLISSITAASPKIADYPFTTLVPQLGVVARGVLDTPFVVADLPGLIEGAAQGAGLGHRFLRHVERCRVLVHLVDLSGGEQPASEELATIEGELRDFDQALLQRKRVVVGTKLDALDEEREQDLRAAAEERELPYFSISAVTHDGVDALVAELGKLLEEDQPTTLQLDHPEASAPVRRLTLDELDRRDE